MDVLKSNSNQNQINRRQFLNFAWIGSLGMLTAGFFSMFGKFSLPVIKKGEFGSVIDVSVITEIPGINESPINHPKGKFWLVNSEKGLNAFYKACTHLDCLFNWSDQENTFVCPCHGSKFSKEGVVLTGPATRSLDQFPVQVYNYNGKLIAESNPELGVQLRIQQETITSPSNEKKIIHIYLHQQEEQAKEITISDRAMISVDTSRKIQAT